MEFTQSHVARMRLVWAHAAFEQLKRLNLGSVTGVGCRWLHYIFDPRPGGVNVRGDFLFVHISVGTVHEISSCSLPVSFQHTIVLFKMNNSAQVVDAKAKADFCFLSGKNLLILFLISEKCASQFPKSPRTLDPNQFIIIELKENQTLPIFEKLGL